MSSFDQDKIYTSKSLLQEMNDERALKGKPPLPAINPLRGGTSTIARKDKPWKSVPDFFAKILKKKQKLLASCYTYAGSNYEHIVKYSKEVQ